MAFVDEITVSARAGKGGDGVVRWLHLKGKEFGGPSGGDGGRGGDVIVRGVRDLAVLARYRGRPQFKAENGKDGAKKEMAGHAGTPVVIDVPIGSRIVNEETGDTWDVLEEGEEHVVFRGGTGGLGNARFKSSTNQYPDEATEGKPGEEGRLSVEVRLIADAGIIGLPNAGKSSLLNEFTKAKAKIGAYQFTTLEPNLGVFYGFVLADIPGLIEGASSGKGLGHAFLRHIRRTRVLIHCISAESPDPLSDYQTVRDELDAYDAELSRKPEIIFLTKTDLVSSEVASENMEALKGTGREVVSVSVIDDALLKKASDTLSAFLSR